VVDVVVVVVVLVVVCHRPFPVLSSHDVPHIIVEFRAAAPELKAPSLIIAGR